MLRSETTSNDVSFFKHHREVEHREGPPTRELAPVKKSIYSLIDLREVLLGCSRRYLAHLSALDDFSAGGRELGRLTKPREVDDRTVMGINFFERGTVPSCTPCKIRGPILLASVALTCCRTWRGSRRFDYPDYYADC